MAGLERLADSGRKLLLVTGRKLDDLLKVLPQVELFDQVVARMAGCCTGRLTRRLSRWVRSTGAVRGCAPRDPPA